MKAIVVVLCLMIAVPAIAAKKCPPKCKHRTEAPCSSLWDSFVSNLELVGGFRWEEETLCPPARIAVPPPPVHPKHVDPVYLGLAVRLPLAEHAGIGAAIDRDFTDAPHWQGRLYLSVTPWRK